MKLLDRFLPSKQEKRLSSFPIAHDVWNTTYTAPVSDDSALSIPTVWACIRSNSESVAGLQVESLKKSKGKKILVANPDWIEEPYSNAGSMDLISQWVVSMMIDGNAYGAVVRDELFKPRAIVPLSPGNCSLHQSAKDGLVRLHVHTGHTPTILGPGEFVHIPWVMLPGQLAGVSPVHVARKAITLASTAQDIGTAWLKNGSMPSAAVTFRDGMSQEAIENWKNLWNDMHQGSGNAGKVAAMLDGTDIKPLSFSAKDSQFLESRQLQVSELARIWGVPNHAINDASGSTSWGSGLAEQTAGYVNFTIKPIAMRIERALTKVWALYQANYEVKLNQSTLLLGDPKTKTEVAKTLKESGIITANEARNIHGYAAIDDPEANILKASTPTPSEPQIKENENDQ